MGGDPGCLASQAGVRGQADTAKGVHWAGLTEGCTGNVPVSSTGGGREEWNLLANCNLGIICKEVLRNNLRIDRGLGIFWGCGDGEILSSAIYCERRRAEGPSWWYHHLHTVALCSKLLRDAYVAGLVYFLF